MGRTQDIVAYDFNTRLLKAKHKALDTLTNVLEKAEAKGADPKIIAQVRMAATAILRTRSEPVGCNFAAERRKAEEPAPAPAQPSLPPQPVSPLPHVPLADEAGSRSVKWLQRELKRAGLPPSFGVSLDTG